MTIIKIENGDIVEVLSVESDRKFNGKIEIGNRYIATSDPYAGGQINIINPLNPAFSYLSHGTYTLYKKNPLIKED